PPRSSTSSASGHDFAGLVSIGDGRTMYLECYGHGSPTVILESGYRGSAAVWAFAQHAPAVLEGVARQTRVCAYDRPGTAAHPPPGRWRLSRSTPVRMPRTARAVVFDL